MYYWLPQTQDSLFPCTFYCFGNENEVSNWTGGSDCSVLNCVFWEPQYLFVVVVVGWFAVCRALFTTSKSYVGIVGGADSRKMWLNGLNGFETVWWLFYSNDHVPSSELASSRMKGN